MSLYTDFKQIMIDLKALGDTVKNGPVKDQIAELRERVLSLQEKALDTEHRHIEAMANLKAEHAKAIQNLQAENSDLKAKCDQLEARPSKKAASNPNPAPDSKRSTGGWGIRDF